MYNKTIRLDEINVHSLIHSLLKNLWVIVLVCLSVVMFISSFSKQTYQPEYTSSATFMVSAKDHTNAYNSLTTTQNMASVFAEVFQSNVLLEKIQEQLDDEPFTGIINTTTVPETNLLIVSVISDSPELSFRSLKLITENYHSISDYLFANAQLEVIKDPVVPIAPSNPLDYQSKLPLIALETAIVCIVVIALLCAFRDTVQTPKAARRKLDARLLRTIHHEQRNKTLKSKYRKKNIAPLITGSLISKRFIEDNMSLSSAVEYHMRKREQKVILVTSAGENEGKSTVAVNLALSIAAKGKRVLLLDCDFRKPSLHKILEHPVAKDSAFTTFLLSDTEEDSAPYLHKLEKYGLTLGFSVANHKQIHTLISSGKLKHFIQDMRGQTDYIILDTPPMLAAADAESIARMADAAVMVVRTDFMQTTAINDCLDNLRKSVDDVVGMVLNNYHKTAW